MAADPYKYFRVEARDLLDQLGRNVMDLEGLGSAPDAVPRLLRLAHTLKGAARVVKQPEIAELAHEIEDRLAPFRDGQQQVPRDSLDVILGLVDAIGTRVRELTPAAEAGGAADEPFRTLRTDVSEMDDLLDGIAEAQACVGSLRRTVGSIGYTKRGAGLLGERAVVLPGSGAAPGAAAEDVRALLTGLERGLTRDMERIERELREVRSAAERLRLSPVSTLFSSLERAVRDAARASGKRAAFRGEGGDIRLDGHVLGAVQAALVQVVRNAVAHGIEPESTRVAAGKAGEGLVALEVARRGARVAFVCRDDGRGVDLEAVRRILARKGISADDGGSDTERLLRRLLDGGISTASAVTGVSGRGVGLDVVREATGRLGGQVSLRTQPGQGTTVEIVVPVSLSSVDALVFQGAGASAAIPLSAVRETVRLGRTEVRGGTEWIAHEGALVPLLPLATALGRARASEATRGPCSGVIVAAGGRLAALAVERLLGHAHLLVRPVPSLAAVDPIVGGVTLDAEGDPKPVLDPERVIEAAHGGRRVPLPPLAVRSPILVVDDSLTTRMLEQSILESAGYEVEVATSGEEALEKARRQRFSLFLVDIEMPGMDGFALLDHMRSDPELRGTPALLVTSRSAPEDRARGLQSGARAYVVKSEFNQTELLETIRRLVG